MTERKLKIKGQYIKDFSFENPNSPAVFQLLSKSAPDVKVVVNVGSAKLQAKENEESKESFHEVTLHVDIKAAAKADANEVDVFRCEIKYCGVFLLESQIDEEELKRTLLIEAPSFLFPFAREIIARVVGSGGFSPIMLDPIDFAAMYEQQSQKSANQP
ncbi:protein-export chaperone SecB [Candidatus Mesenet endosymbiont of Agriotes lineatus]|uniref:protein-export chaperone SecB n=1 Tax=Candidatus Mesenet endosymbiont of Agriotes lineatus TaxID=3077948 RepID=UPI0030D31506